MCINNKSEFVIKTKKIVQNKSFAIYFSQNNINTSNNFENLSIINSKKFNNLFLNKFKNFF